jgi:arabinogalactan endo-1,4-beta-galactosidase
LEKRVYDYTAGVIRDLQDNAAAPDMVQIGNEIAGGMLWPDGKVLDAPADIEQRQWERFAQLAQAGAKAVRASQCDGQTIRIMIHIHGGGRTGLPQWFFEKFNKHGVDYDVIGLSFYPAWNDSIDALRQNMRELADRWHKDILVAETSYPWKEMEGITDHSVMRWPLTPDGQRQFVDDLRQCLRDVPDGRGIGFVWWYPEAIPVPGRFIWRTGAEALFDQHGDALPALAAFGRVTAGGAP